MRAVIPELNERPEKEKMVYTYHIPGLISFAMPLYGEGVSFIHSPVLRAEGNAVKDGRRESGKTPGAAPTSGETHDKLRYA
ncbi:hypothetical protein KSX_23070 [Ktedonospora formicarum]|uniref:Uncharacterized protein n=1 Tax=Ktedonospora formicarum TaxID=2778364 RepID=A0A8J3HUS4_9CHLR|nr:hypothetical protein KSX_23070 [Ktedonospora formicarum]